MIEREVLLTKLASVASALSVPQLSQLMRYAEALRSAVEAPDEGLRHHSGSTNDPVVRVIDWTHAPLHKLAPYGTYLVTAGTYRKEHFFGDQIRLHLLQGLLLSLTQFYGWQLHAWAVFSNHYHFVAHMGERAHDLSSLIRELHRQSARLVNLLDDSPGRRVWFNYWESVIKTEGSYLARVAYVHRNPVRHGLVEQSEQYPWCSAPWFAAAAHPRDRRKMKKIKTDRVDVLDSFTPRLPQGFSGVVPRARRADEPTGAADGNGEI